MAFACRLTCLFRHLTGARLVEALWPLTKVIANVVAARRWRSWWCRRSWCRSRSICDHNVRTRVPHLISLFAIPPPAKYKLTRRVRNLNLIHDTEPVAFADKKSLCELIKASLEHSADRAIAGSTSMVLVNFMIDAGASSPYIFAVTMVTFSFALIDLATTLTGEPSIARTTRNWVGAPLRAVRCNIGCGWDRDVSMRIIIKMDRGILGCKPERVTLEALLGNA